MSGPDWRSIPSLSSLRAFEAAARAGSFSAAARELNVTHAAVAQQVRALESELGAKLVRREGRGIALTEAGQLLAAPLREAFGLVAGGVAALRQREIAGGIRGTTTTFIVDAVILPRLADFWRTHPGIQVSFVPSPCLSPVDFDGFDFGIRVGVAADWPDFRCEPLLECETVFVASPELAASASRPEDIPWILGPPARPDRRLLEEAGVDTSRISVRDIGEPSLEIEAAKRGIGAIMATEVVVRRELAEGALVRLGISHPGKVTYQIVLPKGPIRPAVRTFVDWLRSALVARESA